MSKLENGKSKRRGQNPRRFYFENVFPGPRAFKSSVACSRARVRVQAMLKVLPAAYMRYFSPVSKVMPQHPVPNCHWALIRISCVFTPFQKRSTRMRVTTTLDPCRCWSGVDSRLSKTSPMNTALASRIISFGSFTPRFSQMHVHARVEMGATTASNSRAAMYAPFMLAPWRSRRRGGWSRWR